MLNEKLKNKQQAQYLENTKELLIKDGLGCD